jgi:hypothetical protein
MEPTMGWVRFSQTITGMPFAPQKFARSNPTGPAPQMMTEASVSGV